MMDEGILLEGVYAQRDACLKALRAQELFSDIQRAWASGVVTGPSDPRYTAFIGEWNGYQAPEVRYAEVGGARRELRKEALKLCKDVVL